MQYFVFPSLVIFMSLLGPNRTIPAQPPISPRKPWPRTIEPAPIPFQGRRVTETRRAAVRRARIAVKRTVAPQIPVFSQPEANDIIELIKPFYNMSVLLW